MMTAEPRPSVAGKFQISSLRSSYHKAVLFSYFFIARAFWLIDFIYDSGGGIDEQIP
jgi:hypothetical protein